MARLWQKSGRSIQAWLKINRPRRYLCRRPTRLHFNYIILALNVKGRARFELTLSRLKVDCLTRFGYRPTKDWRPGKKRRAQKIPAALTRKALLSIYQVWIIVSRPKKIGDPVKAQNQAAALCGMVIKTAYHGPALLSSEILQKVKHSKKVLHFVKP